MDLKFGDIQETALIPLSIKASETMRPNARIKDLKAKEIIDTLGVDVSKYDPFLSHEGVIARTILYRRQIIELLKQHPDALCVNLGCGFDDKFSQVDNGRLIWYDVDLPDQIAVRRKVYQDRESCTMLPGSALDGAWTKALPRADMNLIIMEGVLEYFTKEQDKTCLNMLCDCFEHGYLLAELHSPFLEKHGKHHDAVKHTNATFGWGTKSGRELLELEPRMQLVSETSFNEEMKKYSIRGKLFAFFGKNINNRLAVYRW
ncbi:MAG: class I SAM-dependent methyltransferase [Oscillospiraceae bacterium]|nr:class I SAM-dependent methyltransferase [Oscillospiraceae bacterium]